ncbi:outer membrane beta-barrel protein [Chitinophaga sp. SYP-B3965]|uniref:outer membrane beta-barrel protein n=1 Tax=Chitinophaga sp. SYP-B3965 TaxID=2663120 RepID=UPI001299F1E4|nr:outer membrane beta-barrel protein [Chitinophaga sp. SYP-B3965]MRG45479.1 outer membrane beta-barrel protein [Chitinophaga sp. SYP-B3965]
MARVFLIFMLFYFPAFSQSGKVVDDKTRSGIGFVTVSLLSLKDSSLVQGLVSDSVGVFKLPLAGSYLLRLSALGYKDVWLKSTSADMGEIFMAADASLLGEVLVAGRSARQLFNISGNRLFATAVNTFDVLKKLPGLEVNGEGAILMSGRITPGVFIDGKPVLMSAEELQQYLASLSPDMIASIEVIANPSSRYDGEYKGIIDIKLKRDQTLGWKGNASVNLQRNAYTYAENNLLLTYKTPKLVYTARMGYTVGTKVYRYVALQHQANSNIMATHTQTLTRNNNFNYSLGVDYNFRKGQRIDLTLRAFEMNRDVNAFNSLFITDSSSAKNTVSHTLSDNNSTPGQRNYAANLNYSAQLGGGQLDVLGSIVNISNRQNEDIQNREAETLVDYWKTIMKNDILIRTAQADLSLPAWKGKIGAGAKFAFTTTKNDLRYDTLLTNHAFGLDSSRTNNFQYDEYISAAYVSYERAFSKWNYALSLRAEHTHSVAGATTRDYLTWLPSLLFTYSNKLQLSVSRRITRPSFSQLNPFRFYFSPLNYWVGNPQLLPSTTTMLNIIYTHKAFQVSMQIGRESDPMTRYPEYDSATNILQYLGKNLPYNDFAAIEVSFPLSVSKWWRMQHNIRGAYKKEQTPYHGVTYAIPITDYAITGSQVFTLPKAITFDLSYYYRSYSGTGLYIAKPLGNVDLSLQRSWMKGKLNTKIGYYDIFDTYRNRMVFREKRIINNEFYHWFGIRRAALTLNYSFGRSTHKSKPGSRNEEEGRAGM